MTEEPDDDDAPDTSVEAAAGAIAELLKRPQEESETEENEEVKAAPDTAKPEAEKPPAEKATPPEADPRVTEAARKAQEAEAVRAHYAQALNQLLPQLANALKGEFADIKSPAELAQLAQTNPERYNRYVALAGQLRQTGETRAKLQAEQQAAAEDRYRSWSEGEGRKIGEMLPELADREKAPALARQLHDFALKNGYSPEQLRMASATDCVMLFRAMQYQNLEEARDLARARARKAPRVTEPGTRSGAADGDHMEADFARLKKSGSTKDAAAVFRNLL